MQLSQKRALPLYPLRMVGGAGNLGILWMIRCEVHSASQYDSRIAVIELYSARTLMKTVAQKSWIVNSSMFYRGWKIEHCAVYIVASSCLICRSARWLG